MSEIELEKSSTNRKDGIVNEQIQFLQGGFYSRKAL